MLMIFMFFTNYNVNYSNMGNATPTLRLWAGGPLL